MSKIVKVEVTREKIDRVIAESAMSALEAAGFRLFQVITSNDKKVFLFKKAM